MKITTTLALRRITSKKTRSAVICAAIFLTMVLFMTVVSIASNLFSGVGLTMRLAAGTDYHGYLRAASFLGEAEALRDAVADAPEIREAVLMYTASSYALAEEDTVSSSDTIRILENSGALGHFYTDITEGHFPGNDGEILLNPLYFPDARVGDTVTLYYVKSAEGYSETASAQWRVSGLMESYADQPMQAVLAYSDTLEDTYSFGTQGRERIYFSFRNTLNMAGKFDALINDTLGESKRDDSLNFGSLNTAYLEAGYGPGELSGNLLLILFSVLAVFFCSFLLIYNIYSIALTQDMQAFGLLNVIGTTHRQIHRIIRIQSVILFAATLPAGLIAGFFIGWKLLAPVLFSDLFRTELPFVFHPMIPAAAALLSLFTLLWSASRPLKKLRALPPIAAVEYAPAADLPQRYIRKRNYARKYITPGTGRLAGFAISRGRRKTAITALSMSMSVILFVFIATICDYMLAYTLQHLHTTDFIICPQQYYTITGSNSEYHPVPENASDELRSALDTGFGLAEEFVQAVEALSCTERIWKIRTATYITETPADARAALRELKDRMVWWQDNHTEALGGTLYLSVVGIPDALFGELVNSDIEKIGDGYSEGYVIYDASGTQHLRIRGENGEISEYPPFFYFRDGDEITLNNGTYTVMTNIWGTPMYYLAGYASVSTRDAVLYLPESAFLREFGEGLTYALLADAKEGCYDLLYAALKTMSESVPITTDPVMTEQYAKIHNSRLTFIYEPTGRASARISAKYDSYQEMLGRMLAIRTVGYSLAAMIFLIGTLNTVNSALSSAAERRREFAMLEAVGMTRRQLLWMLLSESLLGGGAAVLFTLCVGFPLISAVLRLAMDAPVTPDWPMGILMLAVCITVSVLSGSAVFAITQTDTTAQRLRED